MTQTGTAGPVYTAVCTTRGTYALRTIGPFGDFHVVGDVREFNTFEEADRVAQAAAKGGYDFTPGTYVSMR